jgi:hypothetical protein
MNVDSMSINIYKKKIDDNNNIKKKKRKKNAKNVIYLKMLMIYFKEK